MTSILKLAWHTDYAGRGEEWFAIGHEPGGQWFYDGWLIGKVPIGGGAAHVADFARWLLAERPTGSYETTFPLLRHEKPVSEFWAPDMVITIELLLGREPGEPEHLQVLPDGYFPQVDRYAHLCDELEWQPVDRDRLHAQAAALLAATGA